jgi:hypothetical protein
MLVECMPPLVLVMISTEFNQDISARESSDNRVSTCWNNHFDLNIYIYTTITTTIYIYRCSNQGVHAASFREYT